MDLVFERSGKGPPLVLLPGPGRAADWEPVCELLAADHEIIMLDGDHGTGDPGSLLVHLELALAGLGLRTPHIAGDGLGGLLALEAAERAIVASATALSPLGFAPRTGQRSTTTLLQALRLGASLPGLLLERLLASPLQDSLRLRALCLEAGSPAAGHGARWEPVLGGRSARFTGELADVPVSLVWGTRDRRSPPPEALCARDLLPHVRHLWLPGGGGHPLGGDPVPVAGIIRRTVATAERHRLAVGS